jgi:hypothetical protein
MDVVVTIYERLDAGLAVYGIYLDLPKAFGSVSQGILFEKMCIKDVESLVYKWFESFFVTYNSLLACELLALVFIVTLDTTRDFCFAFYFF